MIKNAFAPLSVNNCNPKPLAPKTFKFFSTVLVVLFTFSAFAQQVDEADLRESAEELFNSEQYQAALPLYSQLLSLNVQSPEYNFRFGACQLFTGENKEKAVQYLKFAAERESDQPLAHFYYGLGLHLNYRFDKAIKEYEKYKEVGNKKDKEKNLVDYYINQCYSGKTLVSSFTDINVIQREVLPLTEFYRNYDLSEFGGKIIVKPEDFMSEEDQKRDAKFLMYFQKDADLIYYASFSNKNETGKDLYYIQKLPTGGWSKSSKLSDVINTDLDEDYPFIHPDGNTLYFASKGHNSMGGYDIFKSVRRGDGSWTQPINMEFAINTPWDDFMFITDKEEKTAWFSSNRETNSKEVTVYKIGIDRVPLDLTLIKGIFESEGSKKAIITIKDEVQKKNIGTYEANGLTGEYLIDLRGSGKYQFIVEAEESDKIHTGTVEIPRQKGLKQFRQEMKLVTIDGVEQLQIINHFDDPIEDESLLTADILKKQASLKVNSDESDVGSTPIANNNSNLTKEQRIKEAQNKLAELEGDAELMKQKANYLFKQAEAKRNSSNTDELEEAAIAVELASIYNTEAEKREAAAKQISTTLDLVSNDNLSEDAVNAQLNKATKTIENFERLESFEQSVPKKMESRLATQVEQYESKSQEVTQLKSDIQAIDDEIAYLQEQLDDTRDKDLKAEYQYQIDDAKSAKPAREALFRKAEEELSEAATIKESADRFLETTNSLLTATDQEAETTPGEISGSQIAAIQSDINKKVKDTNPALIAFVAPETTEGKSAQQTSDLADNQTDSAHNSETKTNTENPTGSNSEEAQSENSTETSESPDVNDVATNQSTDNTPTNDADTIDDIATNDPKPELATESNDENLVNNASEDINSEESSEPNAESTSELGDLNNEIREIQASESQPEIVQGDFEQVFTQQINEASQAEDPIVAESRKAEIYDQWVENIDYRIDSLESALEQDLSTNKKLEISNEVASLKTEKSEKEKLAMDSYQAIAELSDRAAASQSEQSIAEAGNKEASKGGSLTESTEDFKDDAVNNINKTYATQLKKAAQLDTPLERRKEEAKIQQEWADALQNRIFELEDNLESANSEDKETIEEILRPIYALKDQREVNAAKLNQQVVALQNSEATSINQDQLDAKLTEYVENYDKKSYEGLYESININPDENQRIVQTQVMAKSWMMSLRNAIVKTEARARNTEDPQLKAQLKQEIIQLEKDKLEVEALMAEVSADQNGQQPDAPSSVIIKGSELYEGYESVLTNAESTEIESKISTKKDKVESYESEINELESSFSNTKKDKDKEEILEELNRKKELIAFEKAELEAYENEKALLSTLEAELLQMQDGDATPAEKQAAVATELNQSAEAQFTAARQALNDAENINKKKDREPAVEEAEAKMAIARVEKRKAQLASELATKALALEQKAIETNYIIPRGKATQLPVVNRKLNPQEQADIKATSEFKSYDNQLTEAFKLRTRANQLEQQEIALQNQAQQELTSLSSLTGPARAAQTEKAFKRFDEADSLSEERAKLYRQAAFIENKANTELLSQPEQAYMNILAYYHTVGKPVVSPIDDVNNGVIATTNPATDNSQANSEADSNNDLAATTEVGQTLNDDPNDRITQNSQDLDSESTTNPDTDNPQNSDYITGDENSEAATVNTNNNQGTEEVASTINQVNNSQDAANNSRSITNEQSTNSDQSSSEPFDLLPPTDNTTQERVSVSNDVLTNTIFELAPDAQDNVNSTENPSSSGNGSNAIPIDPVMPAGVVYKIQVGAFSKPLDASRFKGIKPIVGEKTNSGYIRYTAGQFPNFVSAEAALEELKTIGFPDAFIVAYRNGVRAPVQETRQYEGKPANEIPTPRIVSNNSNTAKNNTANTSVVKRGALKIQDVNSQSKVFYTVQIGVFGRKVTSADVYNITPINEEPLGNGNYRYSSGVYSDFTTADRAKQEIRTIGISDAFVVAYQNGSRVSVEAARKALNDQSSAYTGETSLATTPIKSNAATTNNSSPAVNTTQQTNDDTYTVFIGRYTGEVPIKEATVILGLSKGTKKKKENGASVYYYGKFDTKAEAEAEAATLRNRGLTQAKAQIRG